MQGASVLEFLSFDAVGALLWSSAYCLIGYVFVDRVNIVAADLHRVSGTLAIVLGIPFACYLLWRAWELFRMVHQLRIRTISPALLQEKLAAGKKVAVLDLILCEADALPDTTPGIPGAIRVDPARLRTSSKVHVPDDVELVLYCSSPKEVTSARVAVSLRHKGFRKVWVLEGGLKAWQRLNLPVKTKLGNPQETAARFGIEVAARRRKTVTQLWSVIRTLSHRAKTDARANCRRMMNDEGIAFRGHREGRRSAQMLAGPIDHNLERLEPRARRSRVGFQLAYSTLC